MASPHWQVFEYAGPLYRLALTSFLPLVHDELVPPLSGPRALGAHIAKNMEFMGPQIEAEEAILTAIQPPNS